MAEVRAKRLNHPTPQPWGETLSRRRVGFVTAANMKTNLPTALQKYNGTVALDNPQVLLSPAASATSTRCSADSRRRASSCSSRSCTPCA